jgi:hypothetical protein
MPMRLLRARARKEQSEAFEDEVKHVMISKTRASSEACMYYEIKPT